MYKKFGEFYKIDNGGVPKKPQNSKIAAPTPREVDTVKSPFSAAAYREFIVYYIIFLSMNLYSRRLS